MNMAFALRCWVLTAFCCFLIVLPVFAVNLQLQNGVHHMSHQRQRTLMLSSFVWKDCGAATDPGHVTKITLTPDPLKLPGNVTLGFEAALGVDLSSPVMVDIVAQKKIVAWITLPCIHDLGSCNYPDVCPLLEKLDCPPVFQKYGIPCKCPVKPKMYTLPPSTTFIDDSALPAILTDGFYKVTATMSQNGKNVGCLHVEFSITR